MILKDKIFVAGHRGLVGSAILRYLDVAGYENLVSATHGQLDLRNQHDTLAWFEKELPSIVFLAAATVGGIMANSSFPADFIFNNLAIQSNVIEASRRIGVKRFVFMGSSCIYPKMCEQPIKESSFMTGPLEPTNSAYAVAKIAGVTQCHAYHQQHGFNYLALMPTNLYGLNDSYSTDRSHVIPGLIRKLHEAKMASAPIYACWGTGTAKREFLHATDLARAAVHLAESKFIGMVNVGSGLEVTIKELVTKIAAVVGFNGEIQWDPDKPDGTPRKVLDLTKLRELSAWEPSIPLELGLKGAYEDFLKRQLA